MQTVTILFNISICINISCARASLAFQNQNYNSTPFLFQHNIQQSARPVASSLKQQMRAWTCHGSTQKQLVDNLSKAGIIKSQVAKDAMKAVDRSNYVLVGECGSAYGT